MAARNLKTVNGRPVTIIIGDIPQLTGLPSATPVAAIEPTGMAPTNLPGVTRLSVPTLSTGNSPFLMPSSSGFCLPSGTDASFNTSIPWSTPTYYSSIQAIPSGPPLINPDASHLHGGTPIIDPAAPIFPFGALETGSGTSFFDSGAPFDISHSPAFPSAAPNSHTMPSAFTPDTSYYPGTTGSCGTTSLPNNTSFTSNIYQHAPNYQTPALYSLNGRDPSINSINSAAFESSFQPAMRNAQGIADRPGSINLSSMIAHNTGTQAPQGMISNDQRLCHKLMGI